MDLKQLRERGGFAPTAPVEHSISWTHPDENGEEVTDMFTVHVVKHSAGSVERLRAAAGKDPELLWSPLFISESIRLGDGGWERLTYDDAFRLKPALARLLIDAINAVNSMGETSAKN